MPYLFTLIGIWRLGLFSRNKIYVGRFFAKRFFFVYLIFVSLFLTSYFLKKPLALFSFGSYSLPLQFTLLLLYTYLYLQHLCRKTEDTRLLLKKILISFTLPVSLFISIDLMLYFLGFRTAQTDVSIFTEKSSSVFGNLLGIDISRMHFILGGNHNNYALLIGGIFVISLLSLVLCSNSYKEKIYFIYTFVISFFCLLLADVRGVVLGITVSFFVLGMIRLLRFHRITQPAVLFPLVFSFVFPLVLPLLSQIGPDMLSSLSRDGDLADVLTFNNRTYFWEGCLRYLSDFSLSHLTGFGQAGHLSSGAYQEWDWIFSETVPHNMYFQAILDTGYVGLIFLALLFLKVVNTSHFLYKAGNKGILIITVYLLYFAYSGIFEPALGIYNHPHTTFFLCLTMVPGILKSHHRYYSSQSHEEINFSNSLTYA